MIFAWFTDRFLRDGQCDHLTHTELWGATWPLYRLDRPFIVSSTLGKRVVRTVALSSNGRTLFVCHDQRQTKASDHSPSLSDICTKRSCFSLPSCSSNASSTQRLRHCSLGAANQFFSTPCSLTITRCEPVGAFPEADLYSLHGLPGQTFVAFTDTRLGEAEP